MNEAELGFNAWILVGNVLHALLRGASPIANGPGRYRLQRLDTRLESIQPPRMLDTLRTLPTDDRQLLLEACIAAQVATGAEVETTLGLSPHDAAPVLEFLQNTITR